MADRRSKKISVLLFLFAIFMLLAVITAAWLYRMYTEQTAFSESQTMVTVECSKYYYAIEPGSVVYENGTLYFEIRNTIGANIESIVVQSATEKKNVDLGFLDQGSTQPVSIPIDVEGWVLVYPTGCERVNFKNLSFEPSV